MNIDQILMLILGFFSIGLLYWVILKDNRIEDLEGYADRLEKDLKRLEKLYGQSDHITE